MPSVIGKRLAIAFALAILLLVTNAVISFRATNTLIQNNARVVQTLEIIQDVDAMLSTLKDAETGQRGYILTGDERFLGPYNSAVEQLGGYLNRLKVITTDSPAQQERLTALDQAVTHRLDTLKNNLDLYNREGLDALRKSGQLNLGKDQMDHVREIVAEIQAQEGRTLATRTEESRVSGRDAVLTFLAANVLVLGLLGLVYFLVVRDLGERKRAAERLQAANDQLETRVQERTLELNDANTELERSNRELQDFAFVASHDLQEPLRKIQAFGDRLKTKHGPEMNEEAQDYLARMQNAARRMHTLINDLLTFSRVTTKAQPFVKTDLDSIANDVIDDLEVRLQQTGGRVDVLELPTIEADPLQMRQLLQNLIGNALKFHRGGVAPIIKVSGHLNTEGKKNRRSNGLCEIRVEDNGIGFDEKYLDRIFTPFQRLHGRGEYEGTGIGLAVCRKIVERHGGTLTATSRSGEGSTFIVTLPTKHDEEK